MIDKHQALAQSVPCQYDMITCHLLDVTLPTLQHSCDRLVI